MSKIGNESKFSDGGREIITKLILLTILFLSIPATLIGQERYVASYAGVGGGHGPSWVARDQGLFEKYGLNVDLVLIPGGTRGIQALLAGSTHFYLGDGIAPTLAILRGGDIVIIAAFENFAPGALLARKEIRRPSDLLGKKIGIVGFGGSNELSVVLALKKWNIPSEAVIFLQSGNSADRLAGLMTGAIDATPLPPPLSFEAARRGMSVLIDFNDIPAVPQGSITVRRSFLEKNRENVKRFMQAFSEALYQFTTDREKGMAVYRKWLRLKDLRVLDETYSYFQGRFSVPPRLVRGEGMNLALQMTAQRVARGKAAIQLEQLLDESVIEELEKEGFYKKFIGR